MCDTLFFQIKSFRAFDNILLHCMYNGSTHLLYISIHLSIIYILFYKERRDLSG